MADDPRYPKKERMAWVWEAYRDALGRDPDKGGQDWLYFSNLGNKQQMIDAIRGTDEGKQNAVAQMYSELLGRKASPKEVSDWLASGRSLDQIRKAIGGSQEGQRFARNQAVNATLYQDPAYNAYVRKMNADQAGLENRRLADQDRQRAMEGIYYANVDRQEKDTMRKLANQYAGRGTYRSSVRLQDQGRKADEYHRQRMEYGLNQAQTSADREGRYADQMSKLSRDRDEFEIQTRQNLYKRDEKGYYPNG